MNGTPTRINSSRNFRRRVIFGIVTKREDQTVDPLYDEKLKAEMPAFLYKCKKISEQYYPQGGEVKIIEGEDLENSAESMITSAEEEFEALFRRHFRPDEKEYTTPLQMQERLAMIYGHSKLAKQSKDAFKAYLLREYGIASKNSRKTKENPGTQKPVYWGIKPI